MTIYIAKRRKELYGNNKIQKKSEPKNTKEFEMEIDKCIAKDFLVDGRRYRRFDGRNVVIWYKILNSIETNVPTDNQERLEKSYQDFIKNN